MTVNEVTTLNHLIIALYGISVKGRVYFKITHRAMIVLFCTGLIMYRAEFFLEINKRKVCDY